MKNLQILIVEDDPWLAEQYQRTLQAAGCQVRLAPHAIAAIDMIDARTPDVIILDILLTGPNGLMLLHEIRSHPDLAAIPVIVCSNTAQPIAEQDWQAYGVRQVLDKSTMQPDDILKSIKRLQL